MVLVFGRGYTSWILDYPLDPLDGMNAELFAVDFQKWYCHYLEPPVNEVKCEMHLSPSNNPFHSGVLES